MAKVGETKTRLPRRTSLPRISERAKDEAPKQYSCFLCNGPHRVFECPKRGKLASLVQEAEKQGEERTIASLKLLNAIQAKVEG